MPSKTKIFSLQSRRYFLASSRDITPEHRLFATLGDYIQAKRAISKK
jgi:hypothetical protein